ncbi:membrane protein [Oceanobacillus oncorhynchi subsp. incaldanensis]|uniref:Sialic acid TRAP transporter permease protein SiaT n=1 Tax=Oceanobacillus oncorhynchi TaxID=545501 RepID=A0A0A1M580_9BACI|nr:TRAP transporter large permease [Oceanobacillus oncorhynchi]MDM8099117.1 TRAP transporter large permease [Oceanobacillus oncorhynchi]UUI39937.1 TRAP transporter large permease [Oceanobacillus oncorhynchi]GIO20368.1 membrane protein [Oceanobacillus oncorhynchi subsp. incaldanensis]CEI80445.1 Sialic acid TRAP transporter permease protein SiaT [Oceanobacillus oncorhynchi]
MTWIILIILMFLLIVLRVPIVFAMGFISIIGIGLNDISLLSNVPRNLFSGINSFTLVAIPLFILAGEIMAKGGISQRLVNFSKVIVGPIPGGLALVVIISSVFFAALTGTAIAAAAAIGGMLIPTMLKEGYDKGFTTSLIASASTIGPIIPPSIVLILYGVMASTSISDLFIAGVLPGILMAAGLIIYSIYIGKKNNYVIKDNKTDLKTFLKYFKDAILALLMPIIIIGGIISGIFTATESGVVAVVYALIIGIFVYKEINIKDFLDILKNAAATTTGIIFLIGSASIFIWYINFESIPNQLINILGFAADNPVLLLLIVNIILLIAGTFIDTVSAVTIFTPLFLPMALNAGIDPVHFGIILAVNLTIGMVTPPLGVCLFVVSSIAKQKVPTMFKHLFPQVAILIVVLLVVTYLPSLIMAPVEMLSK